MIKNFYHEVRIVGSSKEIKLRIDRNVSGHSKKRQPSMSATRERAYNHCMRKPNVVDFWRAAETVMDQMLKEVEEVTSFLRNLQGKFFKAKTLEEEYFDPSFIHPCHECDVCQTFPICGYRWRAVRPRALGEPAMKGELKLPSTSERMFTEMDFDVCHTCYMAWREDPKSDSFQALPSGTKFMPAQLEKDRLAHVRRHQTRSNTFEEFFDESVEVNPADSGFDVVCVDLVTIEKEQEKSQACLEVDDDQKEIVDEDEEEDEDEDACLVIGASEADVISLGDSSSSSSTEGVMVENDVLSVASGGSDWEMMGDDM